MRKRSGFVLYLFLSCAVGQYAQPSAPEAPQQVSVPSTTASPEPAIDCQDHADGLYVRDPNQCNDGFYKCANGRSFYYRCPTGLFFGIEDAQCQYKQLIPACGGQRPVQATTAQSAPIAVGSPAQSAQYGYAPQPTTQAPVYQPPQTQAPYVPPTAPVYIQQTTTQAPYVPPTAPVYVQQTTQAPVYQAARPAPQPAPIQAASYPISYAQTPSPGVMSYVAPSQQPYRYVPAPVAPQLVASTRPPVDFNCGSNPDGYYSKQPCTPVYYSCTGGHATELTCPTGTVYDSTVQSCDYPNVCGKPRPPSTTTARPLVNYGYGWQAPTTTTPSALCVGRTDGFYARGHCVPRYLHCANGHAFDLTCPAGLVFRNDSCTYLSDCLNPTTPSPIAVAPPRPTSPPLTWCQDNRKQDGYYGQGCSAVYYSCLGGFTTKLTCPGQLAYDSSTQACEERQFTPACGGHPRPPTTTTIAAPIAPAKPVNYNCAGHRDGYYVKGCSSIYYACNGGTAIEVTCPAGLAFDTPTQACEERQFVTACGGRPRPPTTTPPAPIAPVRPINFNCAGKADGFYAMGCTTVYYSCNGGTVTELNCPAGTNYSPQLHTCDYRSNVPECGGQIPTTTQATAPIAVGSPAQSAQYGYAPQPTTQAPVYQPPQTQAPPVYQPPQTQAPPVYQPPQTQAPYVPPTAPVYIQQTTTQAPYVPPTAPVYVQQTTQAPYSAPTAPVYVQQTTQAPVYQAPPAYQPSYQPQQQTVAVAQPASPVAVASPSDESENQCSNLQNGIYGRKCSRNYFVCTDRKIFEFTCPSGFAYDRTIARCGPVEKIQGCMVAPMPPASQPQSQQAHASPPASIRK
ncbi:Carbohydrate-binding protein [Aphelenchoides bicaudatus]|nr:Carbohydrate-binding protein [Aphelenchoides bicaudatus]